MNSLGQQEGTVKEKQQGDQQEEAHGEKKSTARGAARLKELNEELKRKVEELQSELEQLRDKWLRAVAELDNMKKRVERDRHELIKFANEELLKQILPVVDNLERAIHHAEKSEDKKALLEGVRMIHRQFITVLENLGVKPIEALHQPFDPSKHEAMMQVESNEHEPNTVVEELEKGYLLHDRLLRPSKVAVSKKS
jgi:molecular chaperone GrpE